MEKSKIKILIAEDDYLSREVLKGMLQNFADLEIVGEAEDGLQLISLANTLNPQAIFLDIDMPEKDGLSAAQTIMKNNPNIILVFVTGHAELAVDAFEVSSLDFILKPFEMDRLEKAVSRVRLRVQEVSNDFQKIVSVLKGPEKLYIKSGHELHFINSDEILFIEKDKNKRKTIIHTINNKYESYDTLNELEKRLDQMSFFRSHKSYIINLRKVEKIVPWGDMTYLVRFSGSNADAFMSRSKVQILQEILNL